MSYPMNTNSQQVMQDTQNALSAAQQAFQTLAEALTNALAQVRAMSEELIQVHAVNQRLEQENKTQAERIKSLEDQVWNGNRANRDLGYERDNLTAKVASLEASLAESKAEGIKLREVILNVATATDSIINPRPKEEARPTSPPSIMGQGTASYTGGQGGVTGHSGGGTSDQPAPAISHDPEHPYDI